MLTRRIRGRTFLLRPSRRVDELIRYVVAVMSDKWSVQLHAITVMSNHWHLCVTDPRGNVVRFQRDCHAFIARALNAMHGEFESVWASAQASRVTCEEPQSLLQKIAYTMANPVAAGLVRYGKSWPGVRHAWPCPPTVVARPKKFFRGKDDGGIWPETAKLAFVRPPGFDNASDEELAERVASEIAAAEDASRRHHDANASRFLGRKKGACAKAARASKCAREAISAIATTRLP